jgi:hypothetical protein
MIKAMLIGAGKKAPAYSSMRVQVAVTHPFQDETVGRNQAQAIEWRRLSPSSRNGLIQVLNCCAGSSCSKRSRQDSQKPAMTNKTPPRAVIKTCWRLFNYLILFVLFKISAATS